MIGRGSGTLTLFLTLALAAPHAAAQQTREEDQRRIAQLEERVALLEATVRTLLEDRTKSVAAQEPSPAPIAPAGAISTGTPLKDPMPPELLPEIGKVGAEVGLLLSGSFNPYKLGTGENVGGFIDLPLFDQPHWLHGKVSYEISIGLSRVKQTFTTTSNVAQVTNLTVLNALNPTGGVQNILDAVTGTGTAPFPVTAPTVTTMKLLQVIPFSFKYTSTLLDRYRLRPYGLLGFGTYVTIHAQSPTNYGVRPDANLSANVVSLINQVYGGTSPFGAPLVAGQIAQSPELEARGLPSGHGSFDVGWITGGGLEFRLSRTLSLGFDGRWNRIAGAPGSLFNVGGRIGFHF
jgi:hypothetical protein